jgi:hypothetical protein
MQSLGRLLIPAFTASVHDAEVALTIGASAEDSERRRVVEEWGVDLDEADAPQKNPL